MGEEFTDGDYVRGIEGLALLRSGAGRELPTAEVLEGYAGWAEMYDEPGNITMALEEPAVLSLLDDLPPGRVLDAACGTGRYTSHLIASGREVVGVDASPEMLAVARAKLPSADLRRGSLEDLPLEDDAVAGAVCALALSHLPSLDDAIAELARVLAPGGRLIVSNPHPLATAILGWRATYEDSGGARRRIPEHPHLASDYVRAFTAAELEVRRCLEPRLDVAQARSRAKGGREDAFAQALTGLPAVIVWEAGA